MNQSILFTEDQKWHEQLESIEFHAQVMGALVTCHVSKESMARITGSVVMDAEQALQLFSQYRFDFEELAESLIEDECFDDRGCINL